jgi:quinol monooxygenase YgiN
MAGVVWVPFYATLFRQDQFAAECAQAAELSLRYGATRYQVHRSNDDRYKITMMVWFESKTAWYRYWDGPEMIAFRRRNSGRFQIPVVYVWHEELAAGELGPEVPTTESAPEPEPAPEAAV